MTYRALDKWPASLSRVVDCWAQAQPDAPALSRDAETLSYGGLAAEVAEAADRLGALGVSPGDRVALAGVNTIEWAVALLATLRCGAIAVPLNYRLSPSELERQLELCSPSVLLHDRDLLDRFEGARMAPDAALMTLGRADAGSLWTVPPTRHEEVSPAADSPALISFTSGTTGDPKGAIITQGGLVASASAYIEPFETDAGDSTTVLVPLFHNTGLVDQLAHMLLVGGSTDLVARFGRSAALDALQRRPATYLISVPSIVRMLMLHERSDLVFEQCRVLAYGGSAMPVAWIDELRERWPHLRPFNVYGLTEFTSVTHILGPEEVRSRPDSVGRPVAGVRHRVVDEGGRPVASGETGEIEVAGPMRMAGYWRDEAATRAAFHDGWLRTGDLGRIDTDDLLVVDGRSADVINRGGEKILATQVEAALSRVADVAEVAVVGVPDPVLNEAVLACVVERSGRRFDEQSARDALGAWIPDYAVPERFVVVADLPRNAAGKVDRKTLRLQLTTATEGAAR